jgi:rhodanese-related sulfurtransferase
MDITPVKTLVTQAKSEIRSLSPAAAQADATAGQALLVDIRDIRELEREGRIPGAFHAPRGMLEFWVDPASPYYKPVLGEAPRLILFCASGWRSALSAKALNDMGLDDVAELDGGFSAWRDSDLPVERDS